jgi:hypothetical protein
MLAAAVLVLVLPGAAWLGLFRRRRLDAPRLALAVVGLSSLATVLGTALMAAGSGPPSRGVLTAWTFLVINVGLIVGGRPGRPDSGTRWGLLAAVAAAGFLVFSAAALHLVPPLEDHDMEVRGTAYGLAADFKPYFLTNREIYFPFAHPLLTHFHVAGSLAFTGEIDATLPSYRSARRAEAAQAAGRPIPWMEWWRSDHEEFVNRPALAGTRATGVFLAALVLALLADLVTRLSGNAVVGTAAAGLYLSAPQTLVRSSYAGYFSATVFAMLVAAMLFAPADGRRGGRRAADGALGWLAAAGAFAALVDHKTVVLILGVAALAGLAALARLVGDGSLTRPGRWPGAVDARAVALGAGFTGGTLLWWGYAWIVDSAVFISDHWRMHIAHRILLNDIRLAHDSERYAPSILELWTEFAAHTGYLFLPVALAGIAWWLAARAPDDRARVLAAWFVTGAVLFTLTDWRQTKHLMNQLAPLTAAAMVLAWTGAGAVKTGVWEKGGRALRAFAIAALLVALLVNLITDVRLFSDFGSLTVLGASDVDGW